MVQSEQAGNQSSEVIPWKEARRKKNERSCLYIMADQHRVLKVSREARGRISGDGVELAFGYWPGRGSPVIAIHGLTASYLSYIGVAERLRGRRPLFAMDLRGRGDSEKPEGLTAWRSTHAMSRRQCRVWNLDRG